MHLTPAKPMHRLQESIGPSSTPQVIKVLILITTLTTIIVALTDSLVHSLLGVPLDTLLSLSYWGITHGMLWQLVSYSFLYNSFGYGITLSLIISVLFQMYLLWVIGSALVERYGTRHFLQLYLGTAVVSALTALLVMMATGYYTIIGGATGPILAMLFAWSMLNHETEFLLFLTIPVKAKWLIYGYLAMIFLVDLSQGDLVNMAYIFSSAIVGYLYGLWAWELSSPFEPLLPLDNSLLALKNLFVTQRSYDGKIIPLDQRQAEDEQFLDDMLTKISAKGESSLSWRERRRLSKISKYKKNK
ncbi:MAG: rhomboid family intramembrane serine protease [Chlamydiales bacterium]|nr:rhomboid family intramembrane serine protease [Chlamydiales bacterium]